MSAGWLVLSQYCCWRLQPRDSLTPVRTWQQEAFATPRQGGQVTSGNRTKKQTKHSCCAVPQESVHEGGRESALAVFEGVRGIILSQTLEIKVHARTHAYSSCFNFHVIPFYHNLKILGSCCFNFEDRLAGIVGFITFKTEWASQMTFLKTH